MDKIPLWIFFFVIFAGSLIFIEIGFLFGKRRNDNRKHNTEGPVGSMVASMLGLLAFMLAFTFDIASSRFETRRELVVEEANAIDTAYERADLIEQPFSTNIKSILREYTALRMRDTYPPEILHMIMTKSEALQDRLWTEASAVGKKYPNSPMCALFIAAVNEVTDINVKRFAAGVRTRVPQSIWLALFVLTALSMIAMGYFCGLSGTRSWAEIVVLSITFSTVMLLVIDLDRPWEGSIMVSQQPIFDLGNKIGAQPTLK